MDGAHPADSIALHHAARRLGDLVGAGSLPIEEAVDCIAQWARDGAASELHRSGLQARLNHRMRDQAVAVARRREATARAIRWAVRPLFAQGASAAAIEEAAGQANGEVFEWAEVAGLLREELARARGRLRA
jgi:predicted ABC-type transport system involved in lysophospholipase L1 biosynthesis ATPase subunit